MLTYAKDLCKNDLNLFISGCLRSILSQSQYIWKTSELFKYKCKYERLNQYRTMKENWEKKVNFP